jgi:hypothetical protein
MHATASFDGADRSSRLLILDKAYELLNVVIQLRSQGQDSSRAEQEFKNFLAKHLALSKISTYRYDRDDLRFSRQPETLTDIEKAYLAYLNLFLPILEGV